MGRSGKRVGLAMLRALSEFSFNFFLSKEIVKIPVIFPK